MVLEYHVVLQCKWLDGQLATNGLVLAIVVPACACRKLIIICREKGSPFFLGSCRFDWTDTTARLATTAMSLQKRKQGAMSSSSSPPPLSSSSSSSSGAAAASSKSSGGGGDGGGGRRKAKVGFDAKYALPTQEEQQLLRQIGLDAPTVSRAPGGGGGGVGDIAGVGGGADGLRHSMMTTDISDGTAHLKSGLEVAHDNSLWTIQTKDLLADVSFDYSRTHALTAALRAVKAAVDSTPVRKVTRQTLDARFLGPRPRRFDSGAVELEFQPPTSVDVVGSFLLRAQVSGPAASVDVALEMPDDCLEAKDYLNGLYFEKRALYLAVAAEQLVARLAGKFEVGLSFFRGDERKTMLVLRATDAFLDSLLAKEPGGGDQGGGGGDDDDNDGSDDGDDDGDDDDEGQKKRQRKKTALKADSAKNLRRRRKQLGPVPDIHIIATASPTCTTLTLKRLRPNRTNVRVHEHTYGPAGSPDAALPTPHYSAAVAEDLAVKTHLQQLHATALKFPGFPGALILLKAWLSRRRYRVPGVGGSGGGGGGGGRRTNGGAAAQAFVTGEFVVTDSDPEGVTGFHLGMVLLHLAWQNKVQAHMQPLQMFRVVVQFLGQRRGDVDVLLETGVVLCPRDQLGSAHLPSADELAELQRLYDVVMVECASPLNRVLRLNIAARVSRAAMQDLAWEARRATLLLRDLDPVEGFEALFLADHGLADRFDQLCVDDSICVVVDEVDVVVWPACAGTCALVRVCVCACARVRMCTCAHMRVSALGCEILARR
jgi:hypothetical protein